MPLLDWSDEYLLGIDPLDYEHRDLFDCINALHERCTGGASSAEVDDCLGRLHARLAAHFALEEAHMRRIRNPGYARHKAAHDAFLDEVTAVVAGFGAARSTADADLLAGRVRGWILTHITTADRELVESGPKGSGSARGRPGGGAQSG